MGVKTGDKSRYRRQRKKKLARRVEMRALRKTTTQKPAEKNEPAKAS
jgi:hypothetical protein